MHNKKRVGFIGLGVMGRSMAQHILDAGYALSVYTRTAASAESILKAGAQWQDSLAALAQAVDIIITMVGYPHDVEALYLGEDGLIAHANDGAVLIDMTTSSPELAQRIYNAGKQRALDCIDAPVSGDDSGAREAQLSIMLGGDAAAIARVQDLLSVMGKNIVHQGAAGAGQHCKMANQIAIAAGMLGVCEALAYSHKAGLDQDTVLTSIGAGAAASWSLNNLGPRIIDGNFDPGFFVKHFIKDMGIAADAAANMGLDAQGLQLALTRYQELASNGHENDGTQGLYRLYQ